MPATHSTTPRRNEAKRPPRPISSLRLSSIRRLLDARAPTLSGAPLVAEQERCLRAALPSLLDPNGRARTPGELVLSWVELHCPALLADRGAAWIQDLAERPSSRRHLRADALGQALALTSEERSRLRITTIGAADRTKRQRAADRKAKDAERKRKARAAKGATPRDQSLSAARPWEELGISRRTWERRRARGELVSDAMTQTRPQQGPSVLSSTGAVLATRHDAGASEGVPRGAPLAPGAALVVPLGPIRRAALAALARRPRPLDLEAAA